MNSKALYSFSILLVACLFGSQAHSDTQAREQLQPLFVAIGERLGYMQGVALYKWHNDKAIEDKRREVEVLDNVVALATDAGLEPNSAKVFFRTQISAAKEIQAGWHHAWKNKQATPAVKGQDLTKEIRPALNRLGAEIISLLVKHNQHYSEANNEEMCVWLVDHLKAEYLSARTKRSLCNALHKVKLK